MPITELHIMPIALVPVCIPVRVLLPVAPCAGATPQASTPAAPLACLALRLHGCGRWRACMDSLLGILLVGILVLLEARVEVDAGEHHLACGWVQSGFRTRPGQVEGGGISSHGTASMGCHAREEQR